MFCLQMTLPKKVIQGSKIRGGKLFRLVTVRIRAAGMYVCVNENVSKMDLPL